MEKLDNNTLTNEQRAALAEVDSIMHEVYMMGANDYEIPTLRELIEKIKNGKISPEEAIHRAIAIRDSKMDYH